MENIKRSLKERIFAIWDDPVSIFSIFGFVFTSLVGTLLHFLPDVYENNFIYLIAPTNESVWEHLKLIFYPYLVFMIAEYFAYGRSAKGFFGAKLRGVLTGEAVIVSFTISSRALSAETLCGWILCSSLSELSLPTCFRLF